MLVPICLFRPSPPLDANTRRLEDPRVIAGNGQSRHPAVHQSRPAEGKIIGRLAQARLCPEKHRAAGIRSRIVPRGGSQVRPQDVPEPADPFGTRLTRIDVIELESRHQIRAALVERKTLQVADQGTGVAAEAAREVAGKFGENQRIIERVGRFFARAE